MTQRRAIHEDHVQRVRLGHGANCSSVGSVVDTLFAVGAVGASIFVAVAAALREEPVRVVESAPPPTPLRAAGSADSDEDDPS